MLIPIRERVARLREGFWRSLATALPTKLKYHAMICLWAWYTTQVKPTAIASEVTVFNIAESLP